MLMAMMLPMMVACGDDRFEDTSRTISKSQLIGTWYAINDGWILVFTTHQLSSYEFYGTPGDYKLKAGYVVPQSYSIDGNRIISDKGEATVYIDGNTMQVSGNNRTLIYTKFDGTPSQLLDYLNGK